MTMRKYQTNEVERVERIEASFLSNIDRGEQALAAAESDYQRLQIRDMARAGQIAARALGQRRFVRRFSVLAQRAERAIFKVHPRLTPEEKGTLRSLTLNGDYERPTNSFHAFVSKCRAVHENISDDEFEAIAADQDSDEPVTRQLLLRLGANNRGPVAPAYSGASAEKTEVADVHILVNSSNGAVGYDETDEVAWGEGMAGSNPDLVEDMIGQIGDQVRDIVAQLPGKADRVMEIVQEDLKGLEKRFTSYPQNTARMAGKIEKLRDMQERGVIPYTIWDFPFRDDYAGDKDYHGNCSPQIVEQCIWRLTEEGDIVVDPMAGSGTTADVCNRYNRRSVCYDLHPIRHDVEQADARHLPLDNDSADMVFIHPPYWDMVKYSKGSDMDDDLSRAASLEQFLAMLKQAFSECKRILKPNRYLCVLLGDPVNAGQFRSLTRKAANILEDLGMEDAGYAVKLAHGDTSRRKSGVIVAELVATNNLKVSHDLVLFFRKGNWANDLPA